MSRTQIPLRVDDLSPFAKTLRQGLAQHQGVPSHVELLNLIAKAAGFGNYQHLRALSVEGTVPDAVPTLPEPPEPNIDRARVDRAANHFDTAGQLVSWPSKPNLQTLCLWVLWSRIPVDAHYDERGFSALLDTWHSFGDAALLRREMWSQGMIHRTQRGNDYHRLAATPPPELQLLQDKLAARQRAT